MSAGASGMRCMYDLLLPKARRQGECAESKCGWPQPRILRKKNIQDWRFDKIIFLSGAQCCCAYVEKRKPNPAGARDS